MSEQWQGDWMRDRETGQLIDGPALSRYEMFMLIRELRATIHAHALSIRDKDVLIEAQKARVAVLEEQVERIPILEAQISTLQKLNNSASEEVRAKREQVWGLEASLVEQHHAAGQLAASVIRLDEQVRKLTEPKP